MRARIQTLQLTAWLLVAMIGPMLSVIGNSSLTGVLGTIVICVAVSGCIRWMKIGVPKWVRCIQLIWITIYLGIIARKSVTCWEISPDTAALPLVLLTVAALASKDGPQRSARSSAVLFWFVVPVTGLILLAGCKELDIFAIRVKTESPDWMLMPLLLLPALGGFLSENGGKGAGKATLFGGVIALTLSLWMDASLTPEVAIRSRNTFYEYTKGINLFGVAERFEAVSACLLTAGWFALFTLLQSVVHETCETIRKGTGTAGVWTVTGVSVLVMYNLHIPMQIAGMISLICWGFLPILAQGIERVKISKKPEKRIDKGEGV